MTDPLLDTKTILKNLRRAKFLIMEVRLEANTKGYPTANLDKLIGKIDQQIKDVESHLRRELGFD